MDEDFSDDLYGGFFIVVVLFRSVSPLVSVLVFVFVVIVFGFVVSLGFLVLLVFCSALLCFALLGYFWFLQCSALPSYLRYFV